MARIAVIQHAPAILNKTETLHQAVEYVEQAASNGAELVIFPEAFIPGYPAWIWRLRPGSDWDLTEEIHKQLLDNAVDLDTDDPLPLYDAAQQHGVTIVCGLDEKDNRLSRATLYNTVVVISPEGQLLNRHRKLMPTNPERMVWGFGDATGLKVIDTPIGRIGTLICWENYMPLARYSLYAQGIEFYIAPTYDSGEGWISSMRHIALEGRCWVIGSGNALRGDAFPDNFPAKHSLYPDPEEWINAGDSVIVAPNGKIVAGPMHNEYGILYADLDREKVGLARRALDVVGHYARPDIFTLQVNTEPQSPVEFKK